MGNLMERGNAFMQEQLRLAPCPVIPESNLDRPGFEPSDISYDEGWRQWEWKRDAEEVNVATQEVLENISEEDIKDIREAFPNASPETSIAILVQEKLARDGLDDLADGLLQGVLNSTAKDFWKLIAYEFVSPKDEDDVSFGLPQMKPDRAIELLNDPAVGEKLKELVGLTGIDPNSGDGKLKLLESLLQDENALAFVSANNQLTYNAWETGTQHCEEPVDISQGILATLYSIGTARMKENIFGFETDEYDIHCEPGVSERGNMIQGLADQINDHYDIDSIAHPEAPKSSKAAPINLASTDTRPRRAERTERTGRSAPTPRPRR